VATPDSLRAVGMLPSLCFLLALILVDLLDRLQPVFTWRRDLLAGALPGAAAVVLLVPEVASYFGTFRTLPAPWAPETHEGEIVASLGTNGPVYSIEMQEHTVNSGWVRLLSPQAEHGRVPNPGREVPFLAPVVGAVESATQRPSFFPDADHGFSILMTPDPNQRPYLAVLQEIYPQAVAGDGGGDQRQSLEVSPGALDAADGVTVVDASGALRAAQRFGEIPSAVSLPGSVTWRAGLRIPTTGNYTFTTSGASGIHLRIDGIAVANGPGDAHVYAAGGVHFIELDADVNTASDQVGLAINGSEPTARQSYRLMDAPWGLLARLGRPTGSASDLYLDTMLAMAFWDPELSAVMSPNQVVWSGMLIAPRTGAYRMAFASEDTMQLQLDGLPANVVTVKPDDWRTVGTGSTVDISEGAHRVRITLDVTHGGRELARWNWVPPDASGAMDVGGEWSVVPPWVLRPEAPVSVLP
jgi:hypothetical protein